MPAYAAAALVLGACSPIEVHTQEPTPAPIQKRQRGGRDPTLAGLRDITNAVTVTFEGVTVHRAGPTTAVIVSEVAVTNTSADTVRGPLWLQAFDLVLTYQSARVRVTLDDADGSWGSAHVWDLSGALRGNRLPPGATCAPLTVWFRLTDTAIVSMLEWIELRGATGTPRLQSQVRVLGSY